MIRKQDLGQLDFIAEGGVGKVYRVPGFRLPGHAELAYKELKPTDKQFTPEKRQQALEAMLRSVAFRNGLSQADRDDLDEYTTWPIDMVDDQGGPCGCVMPLIPSSFFLTTHPPNGPQEELVFDLSWLSAKESQAQNRGIDRSGIRELPVRIALLAHLVYAVGRLHKHGAVYGDLSLKNAALAVDPPRVKLLDCDAVAALNDPDRVQLHSNFFSPPELDNDPARLQDDRTDVYKLGLCIIRGLQQGAGITQTKDPARLSGMLDASAVALIARAVGPDPTQRPSAKDLFYCLKQNLDAKMRPPELRSVSLGRRVLPRGTDVEVVWEATGGDEVRIQGPNGLDVRLPDTGASVARYCITPAASGEITVEVSNNHGSTRAVAGEVMLFELPALQLDMRGRLPRPDIGALPDVELPARSRTLPSAPAVSTGAHPPPRIAPPPLAPVTEVLSAVRTAAAPLEGLAAVHEPVVDVAAAARRALDTSLFGASLGPVAADSAGSARAVLDLACTQLRERVEKAMHDLDDRKAPL